MISRRKLQRKLSSGKPSSKDTYRDEYRLHLCDWTHNWSRPAHFLKLSGADPSKIIIKGLLTGLADIG